MENHSYAQDEEVDNFVPLKQKIERRNPALLEFTDKTFFTRLIIIFSYAKSKHNAIKNNCNNQGNIMPSHTQSQKEKEENKNI